MPRLESRAPSCWHRCCLRRTDRGRPAPCKERAPCRRASVEAALLHGLVCRWWYVLGSVGGLGCTNGCTALRVRTESGSNPAPAVCAHPRRRELARPPTGQSHLRPSGGHDVLQRARVIRGQCSSPRLVTWHAYRLEGCLRSEPVAVGQYDHGLTLIEAHHPHQSTPICTVVEAYRSTPHAARDESADG